MQGAPHLHNFFKHDSHFHGFLTFNMYVGEFALFEYVCKYLSSTYARVDFGRQDQNSGGHGLRTPNEGRNQRYLKNWADVADKICFGCT